MESKDAKILLEKYSNGNCSPEEEAIVESWYLNASLQANDDDLDAPDFKKANEKLQSRLGIAPKGGVKLWPRIAAAASIVLIVGAGLSYYLQKPAMKTEIVYTNDIAPGKHTATLTLSNGKKIVLQDASTGELANQSGVSITKTADGQVVYHVKSAKASGNAAYNTLSTANGEQYQIELPDGTKVWLNAATTLKFPLSFAGLSQRNVQLNGEAYFEVSKDKHKPFIVHSERQDVEVLGTHFNINTYADEPLVKTTLLEGSVKVNSGSILKPGEQSALDKVGAIKIAKVNLEEAIAWKKGYFEFNDENVYEIMRKVARWYNVEVVYEGSIPLDAMEGTMSRFQSVSKVLEIMQSTGLVKFRIEGKKIYVSKT